MDAARLNITRTGSSEILDIAATRKRHHRSVPAFRGGRKTHHEAARRERDERNATRKPAPAPAPVPAPVPSAVTEDGDDDEAGEDGEVLDLGSLLQALGAATGAGDAGMSTAAVAAAARPAVIRVLCQGVEFDFMNPFRRAGDAQGVGSGFVIDAVAAADGSGADCTCITNAHVVESASRLWVTFPSTGERRFDATVLGVCFDSDIAVLRVRSPDANQPVLSLSESNANFGENVIALGYPLAVSYLKITQGVLSGMTEGLLQTTAALNPGNSGGPLLNGAGEVVGINVAIVDGSQNVGFAIPVTQLCALLDSLKDPSRHLVIHKPVLGADFCTASDALHDFVNSGGDAPRHGVYVRRAYPGFPLHAAGVRDGDMLHVFSGYDIDNFGDAQVPELLHFGAVNIDTLVGRLTSDSKPDIVYSRDGKVFKATLSLEDPSHPGHPILPAVREYYPPFEKIDHVVIAGLVLMPLTVNHIKLLHEEGASAAVLQNLTPMITGFAERLEPSVVIANILVGSSASRLDGVLSPGSLLFKVNGIKVTSLDDVRAALRKPVLRGETWYVTFETRSNELVVLVLKDVLREEFELAQTFLFPVSPIVVDALKDNPAFFDYALKDASPEAHELYENALATAERKKGK